jgi:hypothetical protein
MKEHCDGQTRDVLIWRQRCITSTMHVQIVLESQRCSNQAKASTDCSNVRWKLHDHIVEPAVISCADSRMILSRTSSFRQFHCSNHVSAPEHLESLCMCMSTAAERQSLIPSHDAHGDCHDTSERQYALPRRKRTKYIYKSRSPSHRNEGALHFHKKRRQCVLAFGAHRSTRTLHSHEVCGMFWEMIDATGRIDSCPIGRQRPQA